MWRYRTAPWQGARSSWRGAWSSQARAGGRGAAAAAAGRSSFPRPCARPSRGPAHRPSPAGPGQNLSERALEGRRRRCPTPPRPRAEGGRERGGEQLRRRPPAGAGLPMRPRLPHPPEKKLKGGGQVNQRTVVVERDVRHFVFSGENVRQMHGTRGKVFRENRVCDEGKGPDGVMFAFSFSTLLSSPSPFTAAPHPHPHHPSRPPPPPAQKRRQCGRRSPRSRLCPRATGTGRPGGCQRRPAAGGT